MKEPEKERKERKEMKLLPAVAIFFVIGIAMTFQRLVFKSDMGAMFMILWVLLIPIGIYYGFTAEEMQNVAITFTNKALPAIYISLIVGALMSCWIASGATPAVIYYGIKLINPRFFLVTAMLLCSVVSLLSGTSKGSVGTAGVAMIGIGNSLGIPPAVTAGAIICGSFFGDKMSPMSDTTILASAVSGVDIFKHIRHMVYDQVPTYLFSLIVFLILGMRYGGQVSSAEVDALMLGLEEHFNLGIVALLPIILTAVFLFMKLPVLFCMLAGSVSGIVVAIFYQGMDVAAAFRCFYSGYSFETSNAMLSTLLNRGGIASMWSLAGITLFGFTVAGMLDHMKVLDTIANALLKYVRNTAGVTVLTIIFGVIGNAVAMSQNFAIVMTGTLMAPVYKKYNMAPKNCSRDLEAGGTYGAMFIPWNTNAAFAAEVLGVSVVSYIPYVPLLYLTPILVILYAAFKIKLVKIYEDEGYVDVSARLEQDTERQKVLGSI